VQYVGNDDESFAENRTSNNAPFMPPPKARWTAPMVNYTCPCPLTTKVTDTMIIFLFTACAAALPAARIAQTPQNVPYRKENKMSDANTKSKMPLRSWFCS
jgi:hypothetical protein